MDTTCTCHCDDTCFVHNTSRSLTYRELAEFWKQMLAAQAMQSEEIDLWEGWGEHSDEYMFALDQRDWYQFQIDSERELTWCDDVWEDLDSFRRENDMSK